MKASAAHEKPVAGVALSLDFIVGKRKTGRNGASHINGDPSYYYIWKLNRFGILRRPNSLNTHLVTQLGSGIETNQAQSFISVGISGLAGVMVSKPSAFKNSAFREFSLPGIITAWNSSSCIVPSPLTSITLKAAASYVSFFSPC